KTRPSVGAGRGKLLPLTVSDETFAGNCAAGAPLSQDDADFVTQRIFPLEFAGQRYDAASCASAGAVRGWARARIEPSGKEGAGVSSYGASDGSHEPLGSTLCRQLLLPPLR